MVSGSHPPTPRRRTYQPALGARLFATEDGVLALLPSARSLKIDLGSRPFETELLEALNAGADLSALCARYPAASVDKAIAALERSGVISTLTPVQWVDLIPLAKTTDFDEPSQPEKLADAAVLLLSARLGDSALEPWLTQARTRHLPALLAWTTGTSVTVGYDDGRSRPCLRCALLYDVLLPDVFPGVLEGQSFRATASAPSDGAALARSLLSMLVQSGAERPSPGRALVVNTQRWTTTWERYGPHPSCRCVGEAVPLERNPAIAGWPDAAARRFSPLICVDEGADGRPARVLFRRSRSPWAKAAADYGIASAGGERAALRAFGEGVERFCMLHAPPDVPNVPATKLGATAFDEATLRGMMFRPEERSLPGFRLPEYTEQLALDWSWATHASSGERKAVPTCLVGRAAAGTPCLIDTTSNGYAAHTERDKAVALAVLEVIERDAVLLWWYASLGAPRIIGWSHPPGWGAETRAFLMTRDVDLPVVMLVSRLPSGALRLTSAAATTFRSAWSKAESEMDSGLWTLKRNTAAVASKNLSDAAAHHGPSDHLDYYLDPANARPLAERLWSSPVELEADRLVARWGPGTGDEVETVVAATERAQLDTWLVDRSLPAVFGAGWHVVRAFIPGTIEVSWGQAYRRLASPRLKHAWAAGGSLNPLPHPVA